MTALQHLLCGSCGAPIVWTITDAGERMPCDAHPVAGGNVRIIAAPDGSPARSKVVGNTIDLFDPDDDGTRYVSHFATCPQADEWRAS